MHEMTNTKNILIATLGIIGVEYFTHIFQFLIAAITLWILVKNNFFNKNTHGRNKHK